MQLSWNSSSNTYSLEPRHSDDDSRRPETSVDSFTSSGQSNRITKTSRHSKDSSFDVPVTVRVKCEDVTTSQADDVTSSRNEAPSTSGYLVPKRCLSMSSGGNEFLCTQRTIENLIRINIMAIPIQ